MKQRLGIAAAMLGDPRVLILDEPANGLDPEGIRWMREFLQALAAEGRTVLRLQPPAVRDGAARRRRGDHRGRQADPAGPGRRGRSARCRPAQVRVRTPQAEALADGAGRARRHGRPAAGRRAAGHRRSTRRRSAGPPWPARSSCTSWSPNEPDLEQVFLRTHARKGGHPMNLRPSRTAQDPHHQHVVDLRRLVTARRCGRLDPAVQLAGHSTSLTGRQGHRPRTAADRSGRPQVLAGRDAGRCNAGRQPLHLGPVLRRADRDAARRSW